MTSRARDLANRAPDFVSVRDYGAVGNGVTDDTAAIQAAIDGVPAGTTIFFPRGTYSITSQLLVSGKNELTLLGERGAKLLFTDGSYIGLLFSGASQRCKIENFLIWGTNTTSPAITLIKSTDNAAYFTVKDCNFAYASAAVMLAQTYIVKLIGNVYSNCDRYVYGIDSEGSNTDLALIAETYGTSLIGSNAHIDLTFIQSRLTGCYFETESQTKDSLYFRTGCQYVAMTGTQFSNSGRVRIGASNYAAISGNTLRNTYGSNASIRVDSGADAAISGNNFVLTPLVASVFCISASGSATVTGNTIRAYSTGVSVAAGNVAGNSIIGCTTGIACGASSTVVVGDNYYESNTADITNSSTTATAPGTFTGTLTGCTTSPTGTCRYEVNNGYVTLFIPAISATSNTTALTITGLPTAIQAAGYFGSPAIVIDNGTQYTEQCSVTGDTITFYRNSSATGFTNSGTKGVRACIVTYRLRNV